MAKSGIKRKKISSLMLRLERILNNFKLRKRLAFLFIICVLLPLIVTDGIVFFNVKKINRITTQQELRSDAEAIKYGLVNRMVYPIEMISNIYKNSEIESLLNFQYDSTSDYYNRFYQFYTNSMIGSWRGLESETLTVYADNETILNGGLFYKLSYISDESWYQDVKGKDGTILMFDFGKDRTGAFSKRRVLLVRNLDSPRTNSCEKLVKMELNYKTFVSTVFNDSIESYAYVCVGDKVIFSNDGGTHYREPYPFLDKNLDYEYKYDFDYLGTRYTIYLRSRDKIWGLGKNATLIVAIMILFNIFLPFGMIILMDRSITRRINILERAFEDAKLERLKKIKVDDGNDEIHSLMTNYNIMADRMNELIQTVYIDTLKAQENDIARKNAELLALHSQINPHFLFNALESIRMHSVIKNERETAEMVEHLATMERANVSWQSDTVTLRDEMKFVIAYLDLQKYRFGDKLKFQLDIDDDCYNVELPKLSIVTFVENACVHGLENKAKQGWIFIRVYRRDENVIIEVEDTGIGLSEMERIILQKKMEDASIELLKSENSIGVINACLRLKMMTEDKVKFVLESDEGIGTLVQIILPTQS